jgi:hypothetical protein
MLQHCKAGGLLVGHSAKPFAAHRNRTMNSMDETRTFNGQFGTNYALNIQGAN